MKFSSIAAISSLFLLSVNAQSRVPLEITFKKHSHKNIAFFASFGGSSHYTWVLNIVNELGERGHNTYFITGVSQQMLLLTLRRRIKIYFRKAICDMVNLIPVTSKQLA